MDARKARGLAICEMGSQVEKVDDSNYRVKSQSTDAEYDVRVSRSSWECTCWDYEIGRNCCKHVYAVGFSMSIADDDKPATVLEPARTDACPYCLSENVRKKGFRKNGFREPPKVPVQALRKAVFHEPGVREHACVAGDGHRGDAHALRGGLVPRGAEDP